MAEKAQYPCCLQSLAEMNHMQENVDLSSPAVVQVLHGFSVDFYPAFLQACHTQKVSPTLSIYTFPVILHRNVSKGFVLSRNIRSRLKKMMIPSVML